MKLNIELDIPKRIADAVKEHCMEASVTLEEYVYDCISNDINIRKYGDLNDLLCNKEDVNVYDIKTIVERKKTDDGKVSSEPKRKTVTKVHRVIKCK